MDLRLMETGRLTYRRMDRNSTNSAKRPLLLRVPSDIIEKQLIQKLIFHGEN